jgi:hypothetical protein
LVDDPHKQTSNVQHAILEAFHNNYICCGRNVMENLFVILEKKLQIFIFKNHLHVLFLLDVIICCSILYNRILDNKDLEIEVHWLN